MPRATTWLARALALAIAYLVVAELGLRYASIGVSVSPVWPPTGLAIAALLFMGLRYWPAVFAGALVANALTAVPLAAAVGIACGNTAEAVLVVFLLRTRTTQPVAIDDPGWIRTFISVAAPLGAALSAGVGVASLGLAGALASRSVWPALGVWWAGDYGGALVVGSVLIAWAGSPSPEGRPEKVGLAPLIAGTILVTGLVFGKFVPGSFLRGADFPYLLFPFVIGAALRFGARGATLSTLSVALLAVGFTVRGGGPFVMGTVGRTDVALLLYVCILSITGLAVGAIAARRRRAEAALRLANRDLNSVVESSPVAIYSLDTEAIVRSWNRAAETLFGWRADEVIGHRLPTAPTDTADGDLLRERLLRGEAIRDLEVTRQRKDGSPIEIRVSSAPLRDEAGTVVGMLSIAADLTELRELETQYRQAQKMEAVGRLAGGIAHDFNNILTAILGTAEMMADSIEADSSARQDLDEIKKAAMRAAGLTRQLLAFSRKQILEPQLIDVNELVHDLEPMLRRLIGEHIELRTHSASEMGTVRADPGQIEQVLVNLVVNARDAMPGGGRVTIETADVELGAEQLKGHASLGPGRYVLLAVSDTGVGIDAETKSHLFEPFFTTKGPGKGTGLGLATVQGIVEQSEGSVWVSSQPGRGATFTVYLPRVAGRPRRSSGVPVVGQFQGTETVLLVEDEDDVRRITTRILTAHGYSVLEARNGNEAVEIAAESAHRIHIMVTDVVLPGINGRELARLLAVSHPELRVLYVSGYDDNAIVHHGHLEPGLAFLQKPFTPSGLARKVREVLDLERA